MGGYGGEGSGDEEEEEKKKRKMAGGQKNLRLLNRIPELQLQFKDSG